MSDLPINNVDDETASSSSSTITIPTERTALLYKHSNASESDGPSCPSFGQETRWLCVNSLPIIATYLLQNSFQLTSIFVLGRLGPVELGAAALGGMFATFTAWSLAFGATTALDTLLSQAWTAACDKTLLGIHLQRALVILALLFIPIAAVWLNTTPILVHLLHQEYEVAYFTGIFMRYLLIGAPAYIAFEAVKKFLQAQGIMQVSTYCLLVTTPINMVLNYLFVDTLALGFIGAPLATSCSYWLMLALLIGYMVVSGQGMAGWGGWHWKECLSDWQPFLRLAFPGILMVMSEWCAFEAASLAASYLGTVDLAAQSIIMTISTCTYTLPYGLGVVVANRVGHALGEVNPLKARCTANSAVWFAILLATVNCTVLVVFRHRLGALFTHDTDIIAMVAKVIPIMACFQLADALASVSGGIIRGIGKQRLAATVNLVAYYLLAFPIGYYLTFPGHLGLSGLWLGLCIGLWTVAIGQLLCCKWVDWHHEALKAHHRIQREEQILCYLPE
ncbi:MATE efflux family protein [Hesseltinella vesiculosa]|uniref:MATE efflux family protein n=1 Tax=Hesseltinella vesiculosa TaxID=101127 RepID=A0A1X2GID4_9FUNG|nr:MATE efflux family protein [Hesseltinella vesiculosa]